MSDINTEGMAIAPGVMETIVTLAVRDVSGVASVGAAPSGIRSLLAFKQSTQGVVVQVSEERIYIFQDRRSQYKDNYQHKDES